MVLQGVMEELLTLIYPELYMNCVVIDSNGKPILYAKLQKDLCGYSREATIFHNKLVKNIQEMIFGINLYDPYVAINMVNGKQLTVVWHVDSLKLSYVEEGEVMKVIKWLEEVNGEIRVTQGNKNYYLGMELYLSTKRRAKVSMLNYLKGMIQ